MQVTKKRLFSHLIRRLALVLIAASLFGCASFGKNSASGIDYKKLRQLQSERQFATASDEIAPLKKLPPITADEYEKRGDGLLSRGKAHLAFIQYEKSLELRPDNIRVSYKKGLAFALGGMSQDAIKQFQAVLKKDSEYALAYEGLGQSFFQLKQYDAAEKNFREAVRLDPRLWKSHNFLGTIHDYRKEYDMAIHEYKAAIALKPDKGFLYNNMGVSYSLAGNHTESIHAFNKALDAKYTKNRVYNNLGLALCHAGRYREGLEAFRKGGCEATAYNNLGCVYLKQANFEKAIQCFEKAIAVNPAFYDKANENLIKARNNGNSVALQ